MTKNIKITILSIYGIAGLTILLLTLINNFFILFLGVFILAGIIFLGFLSGRLNLIDYTKILIPIIVLSPIVKIPGLFADLRLDDIWLAFGFLILLIKIAVNKLDFKIIIPTYAKVFVVFIFWISVTIFISSYREPHLYSTRDWTEVYKTLKLLIYLLIAVNLKLDFNKQKNMMNTLLISILISAVFGILQYFNVADINSWLTKYYIFETKVYNLETQRRVVGTFGNPNIFGTALILGIALCLSNLFSGFKKRYIIALFILFLAQIMSLSRTSLILAIILIVFLSFKIITKTKRKAVTLLYMGLIPVIAVLGLQFAPGLFFRRLSRVANISTDTSFQGRINMWENIWHSRTNVNLLTGTGPTSNIRITFDNEWLELLTHYGLIGLTLFILMFLIMYRVLAKMDSNKVNFYNLSAQSLLIILAASMWMFTVFNILQLMPVIIILLGISLNENIRRESNKKHVHKVHTAT